MVGACYLIFPSILIGVALTKNLRNCLHQDLYIKPKAPIVNVPEIHLYPPRNLINRRSSTSQSIDLRPPSHSWLDVMSKRIVLKEFFEIIVVSKRMRAWSYQRHLPTQDI